MKIKEWMGLIEFSKEHYEISDEFIRKYQQNRGGYIDYANRIGHLVDKECAEPNQRWHLFDSYLMRKFVDGELSLDDDANKVWRIMCPELLLWIAEASNVDSEIIKKAADKAKRIIDNSQDGYARNKAAYVIRNEISWNMLENSLKKE